MSTSDHLQTIRLLHNAMRVEYGRLAAVARAPRDAAHAALIEDQIALTLRTLHHHHTAEDKRFWPVLRARVPYAVAGLDRLEAQHAEIDPLVTIAGDTTIPLSQRAGVLAELQKLINVHLHEEEAVAFPLILEQITPAEFEEIDKDVRQGFNRRDIPVLYGWLASVADAPMRAAVLATVPFVPRLLFKLIWAPSYQRRAGRLYAGTAASGAVPERVAPSQVA
ncbi:MULTISPECIES: hemerythrin domain-containing protein [unclassified Pseudofrankia]|uniref:hemerythrin domain-containing protein n=1 Tax=unclassified Pseudofrankia TaxID=2994372 RepID=UPI0008D90808|nr:MULTISPECIES: hemerythrin domain-containing protein [unclassified Pseudofrankia]MDT3443674.1 hemerythrin domain-containing protein [Pseudofrankia sp. BMG5.37]OHV42927.1 hypothetical protein BCD48_29485 [Pseudofrankia sp. BMG5.36]